MISPSGYSADSYTVANEIKNGNGSWITEPIKMPSASSYQAYAYQKERTVEHYLPAARSIYKEAIKPTVEFVITKAERAKFAASCEALYRNVSGGTEAAAIECALNVYSLAIEYCPVDTGTLVRSAFAGYSYVPARKQALGAAFDGAVAYSRGIGSGEISKWIAGNYCTECSALVGFGASMDNSGRLLTQSADTDNIASDLSPVGTGTVKWLNPPDNTLKNPKSGLSPMSYAAIVHEDLNKQHNNGRAKFLEDAFNEFIAGRFLAVTTRYWRRAITWVDRSASLEDYKAAAQSKADEIQSKNAARIKSGENPADIESEMQAKAARKEYYKTNVTPYSHPFFAKVWPSYSLQEISSDSWSYNGMKQNADGSVTYTGEEGGYGMHWSLHNDKK